MVAGAYLKTVLRMFRGNVGRFISITAIVATGTAVVTGIGALAPRMRDSLPLALKQDAGYKTMVLAAADKIEIIGYIFPVFFIAVAILAAFTSITRLTEEERPAIACYKTLGYGNGAIYFKYSAFALCACLIGGAAGVVAGNFGILPALYGAVSAGFDLPGADGVYAAFGLVSAAVMTAAVVLAALLTCRASVGEEAAVLLRPKSPRQGGKVLPERAPFIWKRLKFKYKSAVRNIFRYPGRFITNAVSTAGSTALIFGGIGLYYSLGLMREELGQGSGMLDAITPVTVAIVICAAVLGTLVTYNLTDINIAERRREMATLKVLGYTDRETAGYIFREIGILSGAGILAGLPLGYGFLLFIIKYFDFSRPEYVRWYVWPLAAAVALFAVVATDVLLYRKIAKIDMNSSLKAVE